MAFFGVNSSLLGGSVLKSVLQEGSSELDSAASLRLAVDVRTRGAFRAQEEARILSGEIACAAREVEQMQAALGSLETQALSLLSVEDAPERRAREAAARAKVEMELERGDDNTHPKYAAIMAGLSAEGKAAVDNVLAPYFDLKGKLERINQVLNAKRVAYEDALRLQSVWQLECQTALRQLQEMGAALPVQAPETPSLRRSPVERIAEIRRRRIKHHIREKTVASPTKPGRKGPLQLRQFPAEAFAFPLHRTHAKRAAKCRGALTRRTGSDLSSAREGPPPPKVFFQSQAFRALTKRDPKARAEEAGADVASRQLGNVFTDFELREWLGPTPERGGGAQAFARASFTPRRNSHTRKPPFFSEVTTTRGRGSERGCGVAVSLQV